MGILCYFKTKIYGDSVLILLFVPSKAIVTEYVV